MNDTTVGLTRAWDHIMSSGRFNGLPDRETITPKWFSERSALKLLLAEQRQSLFFNETEAKLIGGTIGDGEKGMKLKQLTVPNSVQEGPFQGKRLDASAAIVEGGALEVGEVDQYRFRFEQGEFVNIVSPFFLLFGALSFFLAY